MSNKVTVVHCWSAPRSSSTALLYSFEARGDCVAVDEPLYRKWLIAKGDEVARPYFKEMVEGIPPDPDKATREETAQWERELSSLKDRIVAAVKNFKSSNGVIFCKV